MIESVEYYSECLALARRFSQYEPRRIDFWAVVSYLHQFERRDRSHALKMLQCIEFVDREALLTLMLRGLTQVVNQVGSDGIPASEVIIVPASSSGHSSEQVHKLLAKDGRFQNLGVTFFEGNALQLAAVVRRLENPIVVFVDDFAGTGEQFVKAHKGWSDAIKSYSPVTYFLSCVMCSPAIARITEAGVIPTPGKEHKPSEMFAECVLRSCGLEGACTLRSYAEEIHSALPLGFKNMGSMVVIYRNSSNNTSFLLRGTMGQRVWKGLFPRTDQLKPSLKALA